MIIQAQNQFVRLYTIIPNYTQRYPTHKKVGLLNEQENNLNFSSLLTEGLCLTCSLPYEAVEISLTCRILFLKTLPIYICFTSQKDVTFLLMQHLTKAMSEMCCWWGLCFSLAMFWLGSVLIHVPSLWDNWKFSLSIQFPNNPRTQVIRYK